MGIKLGLEANFLLYFAKRSTGNRAQGDGESADLETRSRGFVLQYSVLCSHAIIDGNRFDDEVDAESLKLVSDAAGIESRQKYRNSAYSVGMQYSERSAGSRCLL